MRNSKLPMDLKFLFENKYIECMQVLIILFLNSKRRKGVVFEEVLYYFTLISSITVDNYDNYYIDEKYIQNNYLSSEGKIRDNLIILSNQMLIDINVEKLNKKNEMYIKLSEAGKKTVETLENRYYAQELKKCEYLIQFRKFSAKNQKGVLSGNEN
ncbi:hypothetical protein [Clostridium sp. ZBS2]|uniref:hypothetical protein n=1 Tax=Clostridium sp. ZBS2 TaxID=2949976 RepID=UPI00207AEEA2|nr:hypothetical protein [Clostridium sp. ZBS2]